MAQVGNLGTAALATAISLGALPKLQFVSLYKNDIGNAGAVAIARAISSGALVVLIATHS